VTHAGSVAPRGARSGGVSEMGDTQQDVHTKVLDMFRELVGERAIRIDGARLATETMAKIVAALSDQHGAQVASDIALHVADWNADAAFIVALHLFPERFTSEEVEEGVGMLLVHVPNHLAAAATLSGSTVDDIFGVGEAE